MSKSIKIYNFIEQLTYNYWSKTSLSQYPNKISIVNLIGYYNILKSKAHINNEPLEVS